MSAAPGTLLARRTNPGGLPMSTTTPCRVCSHAVAPTARTCPSCGVKRPGGAAESGGRWLLRFVLTLVAFLVVLGVVTAIVRALSTG